MEDSTAPYLKAVTDLAQRVAVLEDNVGRHGRLMDVYGAQLAAVQAGIDKISDKMSFVDKLEAMDASVTTLVKLAKGALYTVCSAMAVLAAFKAGDIGALQSMLKGFAP